MTRFLKAFVPMVLVAGLCVAYRPTVLTAILALGSVIVLFLLLRVVSDSVRPVPPAEWWKRQRLTTAVGVLATAMTGYAISGIWSALLCSTLFAAIYLVAV